MVYLFLALNLDQPFLLGAAPVKTRTFQTRQACPEGWATGLPDRCRSRISGPWGISGAAITQVSFQ